MNLGAVLIVGTVGLVLAACGGQEGPPRHPSAELTARATAKLELIDLVVFDRARADRVRDLYLRIADVGRDFDLARARAILNARAAAQQRASAAAQVDPAGSVALEGMLAPPLEEGRAFADRYTALMLELRGVLSEDEFEQLSRVR
jgi:hypothetical protein